MHGVSLIFLHGDNHQEEVALKTTTVGCGQVCLWANQVPGFFDHQYLKKESIDTFAWTLSICYIIFLYILSNITRVHLVLTCCCYYYFYYYYDDDDDHHHHHHHHHYWANTQWNYTGKYCWNRATTSSLRFQEPFSIF